MFFSLDVQSHRGLRYAILEVSPHSLIIYRIKSQIYFAVNIGFVQWIYTLRDVYRSVPKVKVKGQLTSMSSLLFSPHTFQIHVLRTTILDAVHIAFLLVGGVGDYGLLVDCCCFLLSLLTNKSKKLFFLC